MLAPLTFDERTHRGYGTQPFAKNDHKTLTTVLEGGAVNDWTARIGALTFRHASTRWAVVTSIPSEPFLLLQDQTEVRSVRQVARPYLLIDHRAAPGTLARIECWLSTESAEDAHALKLVVLSDAARPGGAALALGGFGRAALGAGALSVGASHNDQVIGEGHAGLQNGNRGVRAWW